VVVVWERYPAVAENDRAREWLQIQADLGLARNTIEAYGRSLEDYFRFSEGRSTDVVSVSKSHIAAYVAWLSGGRPQDLVQPGVVPGRALSNATIQLRLTTVRLFYDYLVEEGQRLHSPVSRGRFTPGNGFGGQRVRGIVPRFKKIPWIPSDAQWAQVLSVAAELGSRDRLMLALAHDGALRREELVSLRTGDVDPSSRMLTIRSEAAKGRIRGRTVCYSEPTSDLYVEYLHDRRLLSRAPGPLFLSLSRRNRGQPLTIWTWTDVVGRVAERVGLRHRFATHTLRHLCLTHLARAGWSLQDLAIFAGHRNLQTTLMYVHLSGRELGPKYAHAMQQIRSWAEQATQASQS
jgi:integrase/recombinase XerD